MRSSVYNKEISKKKNVEKILELSQELTEEEEEGLPLTS